MGRYLEGRHVNFRSVAERRALVGTAIQYLRACDIDRSGRGYFFPRFAVVVGAKGRQLLLDNGDSLSASDLIEVVTAPTTDEATK